MRTFGYEVVIRDKNAIRRDEVVRTDGYIYPKAMATKLAKEANKEQYRRFGHMACRYETKKWGKMI